MMMIINILLFDSTTIVHKVSTQSSVKFSSNNIWMWIAIVELIIIIIIFMKSKHQKTEKQMSKARFKEESKKEDIDFNNIINSSFNAKSLYDELKVKCHPDRFPTDKEKNEIANNIFQNISKYSTNYKKLVELKEEAKNKLNINF